MAFDPEGQDGGIQLARSQHGIQPPGTVAVGGTPLNRMSRGDFVARHVIHSA